MAESTKYLHPDLLARITALGFRAEKVVEGTISGKHSSPFHGLSPEFAEYQEYKPGDDLKRLDWRVFARTNRYMTRKYEEESNLRATLLLDASESMAYQRKGADSKFDTAATLAAALATLLIRQQDAVGLTLFDETSQHQLSPSSRRGQIMNILERLCSVKPSGKSQLGPAMWTVAETLKRRSLVVIISDLLVDLDAFYESLGRLQHQGHEILIFHLLDPDELNMPFEGSVVFEDIEGEEVIQADPWAFRKDYQAAMQDFVNGVRKNCQRQATDYLQITTDQPLEQVVSRYLHWRQQRTVRG